MSHHGHSHRQQSGPLQGCVSFSKQNFLFSDASTQAMRPYEFNGSMLIACTPWKFEIAPGNIPSQKESSLPTIIFQGLCSNFGSVCVFFLSRALGGPSVNKEMVESRSDLNHRVGLGASDIHNHPHNSSPNSWLLRTHHNLVEFQGNHFNWEDVFLLVGFWENSTSGVSILADEPALHFF